GNWDLHWGWPKPPGHRLLAQAGDEPAARPSTPGAVAAAMPEQPLPAPAQPEPLASTSAPTAANTPEKPPVRSAAETRAIWPAFRGPNRDGVIRGVLIETDWAKSPPVSLLRPPVRPRWSSFAVRGHLLYTPHQRRLD